MKAVTMERGLLRKVEVDEPIPKKGEVLVKSIACGICGSDLHAAKHTEDFVKTSRESGGAFKLTTFSPVILGHEFCAEIVDYGPNTEKSLVTKPVESHTAGTTSTSILHSSHCYFSEHV